MLFSTNELGHVGGLLAFKSSVVQISATVPVVLYFVPYSNTDRLYLRFSQYFQILNLVFDLENKNKDLCVRIFIIWKWLMQLVG